MTENNPIIVGIGASAGGLTALKAFVKSIPIDTNMTFIVIQHLDPTHKSLLTEILQKYSDIEVREASTDEIIKSGTIYIIPPDNYLEVKNKKIHLLQPTESRGDRKAIDHLFISMAMECKERCAGILMSGSGTDGTAGLLAIKTAGGLTLIQNPDTAEYDSMPLNALKENVVDKVVDIEQMNKVLIDFFTMPFNMAAINHQSPKLFSDELKEIAAILKENEDFDLTTYKQSTVRRRIVRRMGLSDQFDVKSYIELLKTNPEERKQLSFDLLINVTEFFRDKQAFDTLKEQVIPDLFRNLSVGETIRIWVPGCATGEEAYSLAILLIETAKKARIKNDIKIFATDTDENAIIEARNGIFSEEFIKSVPEAYIDIYFTFRENSKDYQIAGNVRDLISFAMHNIAVDPPFSRMHLISCRNVLIYLKRNIQEQIISNFYHALLSQGHLFLGSSDTIGDKNYLFKTISKTWRIFKKIPGMNERRKSPLNLESRPSRIPSETNDRLHLPPPSESTIRNSKITQSILETFMPPTVVIDEHCHIIYNHGDWSHYMMISSGEPQTDVTLMVLPTLRTRLRSAIFKVKKSGGKIVFDGIVERKERTKSETVRVEVSRMLNADYCDDYTIGIVFKKIEALTDAQKVAMTKADEKRTQQNLEQELAETKTELQNTIEELETTNEELRSSHEEALSTNEELQSTNEELESSAEELRSLNEELHTVNAQLKEKIKLVQKANNDVENFFSSTNIPTVFLDSHLQVQRFTPTAALLLTLTHVDIGRKLNFAETGLIDKKLETECRSVLQNFHTITKERLSYDGKWFVRQVSPYLTDDRRIAGVVLVFQDITHLRNLSERAELREQQQGVVAQIGMMALSNADPLDIFEQAVFQIARTLGADFCKILQYRPEQNDFLMVAGYGWQQGLVGKASVPNKFDSQAGFTFMSKDTVIVSNLADEKRFYGPKLLRDHHVVSGISAVINTSEGPFGVIGVHTRDQRNFTQEDANFITSVAHMLATALTTKAALEKLMASEERLKMASQAAKIGIVDIDLAKETIPVDPIIGDIWGLQTDRSVFYFNEFKKCIHEFDRRYFEDEFSRSDHNNELNLQFRVVNNHKRAILWVEFRGRFVFADSNPVRFVGTLLDITARKDIEDQLMQSETRLRLAVQTNKFGSFEFDLDGSKTLWDPLLKNIWGLKQNESPNQDIFWRGVHVEDRNTVKSCLQHAIDPEGDLKYHCIYRVVNLQSNEIRWVEASGQTLLERLVPTKMVGMVIDITESKELEQSLQKAIADLRKNDEQKNEFLSILGHELRNPLAALTGSLEILESNILGKHTLSDISLTETHSVMRSSIDTMSRLLDDLLDLRRVTQNKVHLRMEPINISKILLKTIRLSQHLLKKKDLQVKTRIDNGLYIYGDLVRIEQVLSNLVVNASKYTTKDGEIFIEASSHQDKIQINIQDTGIGLAEMDIEKIFEPFFQLKVDGHVSSGLGIGLALSKKLTELHSGEIRASSGGIGQGSTFHLVFPKIEVNGDIVNAEEAASTARKIKNGVKILVVEDNQEILMTLPTLLESIGCQVTIANTAEDGIVKAKRHSPDAMLVDIGLPDMSGHQLAEILISEGVCCLLIAFSGYSHKEARDKSKRSGFHFHLAKPTTLAEIQSVLASRFAES